MINISIVYLIDALQRQGGQIRNFLVMTVTLILHTISRLPHVPHTLGTRQQRKITDPRPPRAARILENAPLAALAERGQRELHSGGANSDRSRAPLEQLPCFPLGVRAQPVSVPPWTPRRRPSVRSDERNAANVPPVCRASRDTVTSMKGMSAACSAARLRVRDAGCDASCDHWQHRLRQRALAGMSTQWRRGPAPRRKLKARPQLVGRRRRTKQPLSAIEHTVEYCTRGSQLGSHELCGLCACLRSRFAAFFA